MKLSLQQIVSGYNSIVNLNANFDAIVDAIENTVSLDGTSPNELQVDISMGGHRITNLAAPVQDNDAVRWIDVANIIAGGDIDISPTVDWTTGITGKPTNITQFAALADPGADRLLFWDDSAGTWTHLSLGTGLSISGTVISSTAASVAWSGITSVPAYVTSLAALADPGADRIIFWDDSATNLSHLTMGSGLAITGTSLGLSLLGIEALTDPGADRILFWDDSAGISTWLSLGSGLSITGTTLSATVTLTSTTGSFTGTLTGVDGVVSGSVKWTKNGNVVTLEFPTLSGTSNSTVHTITGAPVDVRPTTAQRFLLVVSEDGTQAIVLATMGTDGTLSFPASLAGAAFTASGTDAVPNQTVTYHLS